MAEHPLTNRTILDYVDEDRSGALGICAGGGYAANAALTEHRIKAVGTVVAVNLGRAVRQASASANARVYEVDPSHR